MSESQLRALLTDRIQAVETRIQAACRRAKRDRAEVRLVAVTKTISPAVAALLPELGLLDLGESRPQELWRKVDLASKSIRWHLIGHLQRNKLERTIPLVHLMHSVDSLRLLDALDAEAAKRGQPLPVLLEVNASRESNKHGFAPEELAGLVARINDLRHMHVFGLMTMAALDLEPERCRPTFALVRDLLNQMQGQLALPHRMDHLSMGMSNDFEVAIEEGATLVRVGSALFEGIT